MKELVAALAGVLFVALALVSFAASNAWDYSGPSRRTTYPSVNSSPSPTPAGLSENGNGNAVDRFVNAVTSSQENSNTNSNRRRRR
jgi:hypothetical protein